MPARRSQAGSAKRRSCAARYADAGKRDYRQLRLRRECDGNRGTIRNFGGACRRDCGLRPESPRCASCLIKTFQSVCGASWPKHEVHTLLEMRWPDQLENGQLLKKAEQSGFDLMV